MHTGFWWEKLRERDHWEEYGLDGNTIFKCIFKKWEGGMDWIDLTQHGEMLQDFVDAVMTIRFSSKAGILLTI